MGVTKEQSMARKGSSNGKHSGVDWSTLPNAGTADGVAWGDADPGLVSALLHAATRRGMAVSFSATSNGTGVSITILDGGERPKWYANSDAQLDELLRRLLDILR